MKREKRVAIIGAGAGGLTAAALLSKYFDVTVYERASSPGGKIHQAAINDVLIDAGPTVFTMRWVFEEIFEEAGFALDDELATYKLDVLARHAWRDQSQLDLYTDKKQSAEAIAALSGQEDAQNYLEFCAHAEKVYETLRDPFMRSSRPSLVELIKRCKPLALLNINPFSTLAAALTKQFRDPRLRQLFGRYATYCGSSPYLSPATLMLIAHVEQEGVWAVEGGMKAVAQALADVAEKNGATFRYDADVINIHTTAGRTSSIELNSDEYIDADVVLFNGDPSAIGSGLLGDAATNAVALPARSIRSQSAITWAMSTAPEGFDLSMHNVFFSDDYRSEFDSVFNRQKVPTIPTTYLFAPDRMNPINRPTQRCRNERLFCLINAPATGGDNAFGEKEIEECRQRTFDHLQRCGLTLNPVSDQIVATTPTDFARMFPGTKGALYGMASHGWQASFQRPGVRTKLPGLYLAGGAVHPGPGVPMAALSGKAAAAAIMADCGST